MKQTKPIGIDGGETGFALRRNPSHSGDKGDGGVNTSMVVETEIAPALQSGGGSKKSHSARSGDSKDAVLIPEVIAFAQNTRDEVREIGGNIAGALPAQPGMKQQTYVAVPEVTRPLTSAMGTKWNGNGDLESSLIPALGIPGNWIGRKPENGGNAVAPMREVAPNLTAADRHGVQSGMQVRRLTPTECARLQGFPDDYLNIEFRGKPAADGNKYRALGNSMATPVMLWIGKQIEKAESYGNQPQ